MQLLASASGIALYQDDERLHVVDQRTGSLYTLGFVLILIPSIFVVNGVVQIAIALDAGTGIPAWAVGITLLGVLSAIALVYVLRLMRRRRADTAATRRMVATFDFTTLELLDGAGRPLASLPEVSIQRRMQLASSSPQLVAEWRSGKLVLARGNPFGGGTGPLERVLRARGLMR